RVGVERQIIEVRAGDRVLQILAGPGSGKTEMLVWRVLYDLLVRGTPSNRVMVTTFTRRAATELQVRLVERCDLFQKLAGDAGIKSADPKVHDLRIGTIHSLCDSLLAEFDLEHMEKGTQVVDEAETTVRLARDYRWALGYQSPPGPRRVLNRLLDNQGLVSLFRAPWDDNPNFPSSNMDRVGVIAALLAQHVETWVPRCLAENRLNGIETTHGPTGLTDDLNKLLGRWEEYLDAHSILDFATVQKRFVVRQWQIASQLSHVFVDEFQDNNPIQFALHTAWLRYPGIRLTVVGDDDQALYRFRGSDIECFNRLRVVSKEYGAAFRLEKLEVNHRSTKAIVDFCQRFKVGTVLAKLSMPKQIVAAPKAKHGEPVRLWQGPWSELCQCLAADLDSLGAGRPAKRGAESPPTAAILIFSTSERSSRDHDSAALTLRKAIQSKVRVYNPRSKTAASPESPVAQLLGLISYLI
ncbi:MAG TPA: ATP-dependent helicase, partial [Pirellulales bacterium]|nr:ATP-dependent helicase [Pirellulales bacterium]